MNDKKKDFQASQSDIHTIVDLPIEAVIAHITQISSEKYQVKISQKNSDEANFRIRNKLSKSTLKLDTKGTIRRWNGTFTRLDAKFNIHFSKPLPFRWILGFGLCLIVALGFGNSVGRFLIIVYIPVFLLIAVTLHFLKNPRNYFDYAGETAKRHNDLIHGLADELNVKLKQKAVMLDFDGSEDNLIALLREEKHKHFRLGNDGEMGEDKA